MAFNLDTKPEYYKVIKHGKWKCTIKISPENIHLVRGFSSYSWLPEGIPGRIQNLPLLAAHNCSLEIRSCVLWKKNILVFPLDASIRHHHSTRQRIDMGRRGARQESCFTFFEQALTCLFLAGFWVQAKLESCEQQNWPTPEKGGANHRTRPSVSPAIWSLGFPWSFCTWFWILRLGVKNGPETIPYLVYIYIYTIKLTPCLPSRMQHIER